MNKIEQNDFLKLCKLYINSLEKSSTNIKYAASLCASAIKNGGKINIFGIGHSSGFAMEMINSQNGILPIQMIAPIDLVIYGKMSIKEYNDRNNKYAHRGEIAVNLFELYDFSKNDIFILVSNSGINKLSIDFATLLEERKYKIIVVTSVAHTSSVNSRHESGKKLKDFATVTIDNMGPVGDTLIDLDDGKKICSISSITSGVIAQKLSYEIQQRMLNLK